METFRDSACGKLLRLFSGRRVLQYREEGGSSEWTEFIEKGATSESPHNMSSTSNTCFQIPSEGSHESGDPEAWGMYTVMSQASRPSQRTIPAPSQSNENNRQDSVLIVGWNGPNDSENPQNWSIAKKSFVSSQIWLLTFSIYIGSAIYTPGLSTGITQQFSCSDVAGLIGLTLFVFGYGLGPMIWSPLSELPVVGRSPTYVLTLFVFIWFNFGVVYAKNYGMLMAFRFLTGFIGSPALATGAASMSDIWSPKVRDYMIAVWGCFAISAPVLGPLVGGFAASAKGWTWTIWQLIWISGFTFVVIFFFLPETFAPNILTRRARRIRRHTGNRNYICEAEFELKSVEPKTVLFEALVRPFQLCFCEPIVFFMNLYVALIYGILYIWFEAFPIVFSEIHGFNLGESGLAFLGILVGTICVTIPAYFWWKYKYQSRFFSEHGTIAPEYQLPPACVGALSLPMSLFWFGWTGNFASVHWIVPIIGSAFFAVGGCLIFNCIFCYQAHAYPRYSASVLAGNDFMRSSFGAGFPLFASAMFHNLGVGWACTLLGCLCVVFVPYPFILLKMGKRLRLSSKYARHDI